MRRLSLAIALCTLLPCSSVLAGPNADGVLFLHQQESLVWSQGLAFCGQSELESCASADVRVDGPEPAVVFLMAAFPPEASPRVAGVVFGIEYDAGVRIDGWGMCGDFELPSGNWPATNSGNSITWSVAQTDLLMEMGWFAAYSYTEDPVTFSVAEHPTWGLMPAFADDAVPSNIDEAVAVGSLGFNTDGNFHCPGTLDCRLSLTPQDITVYGVCAGTVPVTLNITDVEDLGAFSICAGFDGAMLSFAGMEMGPFLGSTGRTVIPGPTVPCAPSCNSEGVTISATTSGNQPGAWGDGTLATLRFSPLAAAGFSTICLGSVSLRTTDAPPDDIVLSGVTNLDVTHVDGCFGDYTGDSQVTVFDLARQIPYWGYCSGNANYVDIYDVNAIEEGNYCASYPDGCVDVVDVQRVASRWHLACGVGGGHPEPSPLRTNPIVSISPASHHVAGEVGDPVIVELAIDDAADLGAFETTLAFDPAVLQVVDVDGGALLHSTGRTGYAFTPFIDNTNGSVRFGACTVGTVAGATGSGALAVITFEIVDCAATSALTIEDVTVTDTDGVPAQLGDVVSGSVELVCGVSGVGETAVTAAHFSSNPNPLNSSTELTFYVPSNDESTPVTLSIFDASGRLVRELVREPLAGGIHQVSWDARDRSGVEVPSGAYFARLVRTGETRTERIVVAR